jgi:hypothetical protein
MPFPSIYATAKLNRLIQTVIILSIVISCKLSSAAQPSTESVPLADLPKWEDTLRQTGASRAELAKFENYVKKVSATELTWLSNYLTTNPSAYLRSLRRALKDEQEPAPLPIFPGVAPVTSCDSLRKISIADTKIESTTVTADELCRLIATVIHPPTDNPIKIFIALPMKNWNGRFMGTGGGGYAGGSMDSLDWPPSKGYAVGATDTGNPDGTANFALDAHGKPAWQRMRDNAYIGIHDMTAVGKAVTEAFYGQAPGYSYFLGASTGGRQALTEAQRYPKDYDGILALSPAIARDRYVPAQLWPQVVMHEANEYLTKEKRDAATAAAVSACDGADGIVDGVIEDPTRCQYNPDGPTPG